MAARIFLALSALVWLPYGLYCFFAPTALAGTAGVDATSVTGTIELRAMYGGLQVALGALALAGALHLSWRRPALGALLFLCAGIALARIAGTLIEGELSAYTGFALAFEIASTGLAGWLLGHRAAAT